MKIAIIAPNVSCKKNVLNNFITTLAETTMDKEYTLIIVRNNYQGFAKAVNQGFKCALGDPEIENIILLNDDVEFLEGWFDDFIEALKIFDVVGTEVNTFPTHITFWAVGFKRNALEKVGLLDERFIYGECEDLDWCARAKEEGLTFGNTLGNKISHFSGVTLRCDNDEERQKERMKNKERFREKWKGTKYERMV